MSPLPIGLAQAWASMEQGLWGGWSVVGGTPAKEAPAAEPVRKAA